MAAVAVAQEEEESQARRPSPSLPPPFPSVPFPLPHVPRSARPSSSQERELEHYASVRNKRLELAHGLEHVFQKLGKPHHSPATSRPSTAAECMQFARLRRPRSRRWSTRT